MPSILFQLGQCALAILIIFSITGTGCSQNIHTIDTYVHRALWCSVIETAVWCLARVITYFIRSNCRIPPRLLQKLDLFIAFLWCEMTANIVAQSVQPFIVHATLSSSLRETSTTTNGDEFDLWWALANSVVLFCVLQIIHSVSLCVRCAQGSLKLITDMSFDDVDPKDVPITRFHVLTAMNGCICHLFGTAGLYVERIATGTLITSLIIARDNLDGPKGWASAAAVCALLTVGHEYVWRMAGDWDDQGSGLMVDRGRWPGARPQTMYGEVMDRLYLRCTLVLQAWFRRMSPWRLPRLGRWHCPELAALWVEGELRKFYVKSLAESQPLALLAPWSHDVLHVGLWEVANIIGDHVPRNYSAVPARGATGWLGQFCYMVLGKILAVLVGFLEAAFASFFFLALALAGMFWCEEHNLLKELRQFVVFIHI